MIKTVEIPNGQAVSLMFCCPIIDIPMDSLVWMKGHPTFHRAGLESGPKFVGLRFSKKKKTPLNLIRNMKNSVKSIGDLAIEN